MINKIYIIIMFIAVVIMTTIFIYMVSKPEEIEPISTTIIKIYNIEGEIIFEHKLSEDSFKITIEEKIIEEEVQNQQPTN